MFLLFYTTWKTTNQSCLFTEFHIHKIFYHQLWVDTSCSVILCENTAAGVESTCTSVPAPCTSERKSCCWPGICLEKQYKEIFALTLIDLWTPWKGKDSKIFPFSSVPISSSSQDPAFSFVAHPLLFFQTEALFLFPVEPQHSLGWKRTLEVIWSSHLLKAELTSQLDQVARGCVQLSSEHLQGWRSHTLSGQPVPAFDQPHGEIFHSTSLNFSTVQLVLSLHISSSSLCPPIT